MKLSRGCFLTSRERTSSETLAQQILFQSGQLKRYGTGIFAKNNFLVKVQANVESTEYPAGYVTYQEYAQGYQLKKGAVVGVRLSKGEKKVLVPDVSSLTTTTAAKMKIETAGLVYKEDYEYHSTIASGDIIRQEPKVNVEVEKGSTVIVYVSKGPGSGDTGMIDVPDVLGCT